MPALRIHIVCLALLCAFAAWGSQGGAGGQRPLTMYTAVTRISPNTEYVGRTAAVIRAAVAPRKLDFAYVSIARINELLARDQADIVIIGAAFSLRRQLEGYRDIGSAVTREARDPNFAKGTTVVTLAGRDDISGLADLRGKRITANDPKGFQGYLILRYELVKLGIDPDRFFEEVYFTGLDPLPALAMLRGGAADAVVLPSCNLEHLAESGFDTTDLKVVGAKVQDKLDCAVSSELFPSWSLLLSSDLDLETVHRIVGAVHSLRREADGIEWSFAVDHTSVNEMYRAIKAGPWEHLNDWSWQRLWNDYKHWFYMLAAAFAALAVHSLHARHLVAVRTAQLRRALNEQAELNGKVSALTARYEKTKRAVTVSQISSLIAHELSQPLAGLLLYAGTLEKLLSGPDAASAKTLSMALGVIAKIKARAAKADTIVGRVRGFARNAAAPRQRLVLAQYLQRVVEDFQLSAGSFKTAVVLLPGEATLAIEAKPLDLELALVNLMRNACQELENRTDGRIEVAFGRTDCGGVFIEVADNGEKLSDAAIDRLGEPLMSLKDNGLGLGLSIVNSIAQSENARLVFSRSRLGGLAARLVFKP